MLVMFWFRMKSNIPLLPIGSQVALELCVSGFADDIRASQGFCSEKWFCRSYIWSPVPLHGAKFLYVFIIEGLLRLTKFFYSFIIEGLLRLTKFLYVFIIEGMTDSIP